LKTHLDTSPDDAVAVQLLNETAFACSHAGILLSDFDQLTSDTDSSDDDVSDDGHGTNGTDRVAEKIKMYTHCLLDLSAAIECPAPDAEHVDLIVTQPQRDFLPSAEKTDATLHTSANLTKWSAQSVKSPWEDHFIDLDPMKPMNSDSVLGFGSYTGGEPLEVPTPTTVTKPTSDTKPPWALTRIMNAKRLLDGKVGVQQSKVSFRCPFRKVQARLGLAYTCAGAPAATVSAVRAHLTRYQLKGTPPHLPFLKLCTVCNEDILDNVEFETRHGVDGMKCENPRPRRKGVTGQQEQYDRLCSKIEAYIAAQEAQGGI